MLFADPEFAFFIVDDQADLGLYVGEKGEQRSRQTDPFFESEVVGFAVP